MPSDPETSHSCFPPFDIDDLETADCSIKLSIVSYLLGNLGQALFIRSCDEDVIFTRSHNCDGTPFVQGDSVGGSKLTEHTLTAEANFDLILTFDDECFQIIILVLVSAHYISSSLKNRLSLQRIILTHK